MLISLSIIFYLGITIFLPVMLKYHYSLDLMLMALQTAIIILLCNNAIAVFSCIFTKEEIIDCGLNF